MFAFSLVSCSYYSWAISLLHLLGSSLVVGSQATNYTYKYNDGYIYLLFLKEGSALLFIAKWTQEFRKPQLDSYSIKK